jgi:hypothetical protein
MTALFVIEVINFNEVPDFPGGLENGLRRNRQGVFAGITQVCGKPAGAEILTP